MTPANTIGSGMICRRCGSTEMKRVLKQSVLSDQKKPLGMLGTMFGVAAGGAVAILGVLLILFIPILLIVLLLLGATVFLPVLLIGIVVLAAGWGPMKKKMAAAKQQRLEADPNNLTIVCAACASEDLVPVQSPFGQQLLAQLRAPRELND